MPQDHFPEPWHDAPPETIDGLKMHPIRQADGIHDVAYAYLQADQRRIIAAVNFCQNLPIDFLESHVAGKSLGQSVIPFRPNVNQ